MSEAPKKHTAEDYAQMLLHLLPRGMAWSRAAASSLARLLAACAQELARIEAAAFRLLEEVNPQTTLWGLSDWERVLGLPDECQHGGTTLQERRAAVLAKLNDVGRQDKAYYEQLAATLGYTVTIDVFRPFVCGRSRCGDRLYAGGAVRHMWRVTVHGVRVTRFRVGLSQCGERLSKISRAEDLECIFNKQKEAHTVLIFAYE